MISFTSIGSLIPRSAKAATSSDMGMNEIIKLSVGFGSHVVILGIQCPVEVMNA